MNEVNSFSMKTYKQICNVKCHSCVILVTCLLHIICMSTFVVPSAPTNVHATVISCAKILVTWSPVSFNGAQLNTYKVYYQKSGSVEKNVDASGTQKTLSRLNSLTTYSISVVAVSGTTEGDRSPVTLNTTFGGELCIISPTCY